MRYMEVVSKWLHNTTMFLSQLEVVSKWSTPLIVNKKFHE